MLGKKAMNPGEIFVYMLSLFIVAFILIFGYMAISDFIGSSSDVEMLQFQKTMEQHVKTYSSEYGSMGYKDVPFPGNVVEACFLEYYDQASNIMDCSGVSGNVNPIVKDAYGTEFATREKKNFFLIDAKGQVLKSYYLGNVTVSSPGTPCNYLCIDSYKGKLSFKIRGDGVSADISAE